MAKIAYTKLALTKINEEVGNKKNDTLPFREFPVQMIQLVFGADIYAARRFINYQETRVDSKPHRKQSNRAGVAC